MTNLDRIEEITQRLVQAESSLAQFFDLVPDMCAIANMDGRYVRVNPAWEHHLGWSTEELLSKPFMEFVHPDDVDKTITAFQETMEGGLAHVDFQNRYRKRSDGYLLVSWRATAPIDGLIYAIARPVMPQDEYLRRYEEIRLHRHAIRSIAGEVGISLEALSLVFDRLNSVYEKMRAEG